MKPLSPSRSAHRRGARRRHQQDRLPDRAAQAAGAAGRAAPAQPRHRDPRLRPYRGARHEGRRGGRSAEAEAGGAPGRRSRRARRPRCSSNRSCVSVSAGRPASELYRRTVNVAGSDRHRRRHRPRAGRRQPAFGARRPRRAAFAADRLCARRRARHPRSARHAGARVRRRHACGDRRRRGGAQPDAGGRALPSRRRGDGGERPMWRACRCWPTTRPISARR